MGQRSAEQGFYAVHMFVLLFVVSVCTCDDAFRPSLDFFFFFFFLLSRAFSFVCLPLRAWSNHAHGPMGLLRVSACECASVCILHQEQRKKKLCLFLLHLSFG